MGAVHYEDCQTVPAPAAYFSVCSVLSGGFNHVSFFLQVDFFPTSLCGVLVFRSVPPGSSSQSCSSASFVVTPLCTTPSFTHTHVCHTPFFTHMFATHHHCPTPSFTHHLSHTTLSHTIFVTHHLSHTSAPVLGANARFPTEYDSKGYGLMRLAGHALGLWPVSSHPCDCRTSRLGFHRTTWEAMFPRTAVDDTPPSKVVADSKSLLIANTRHQLPHTHTHACLFKIITHTRTLLHTPSFIAHLLSRTIFTYNSLTARSYTISFVYASFPCPLDLLF